MSFDVVVVLVLVVLPVVVGGRGFESTTTVSKQVDQSSLSSFERLSTFVKCSFFDLLLYMLLID